MSSSLKQGLELSDSLSQMRALTTRLENLPYAHFLAEWILKQPMQEKRRSRRDQGRSLSLSYGDQVTVLQTGTQVP